MRSMGLNKGSMKVFSRLNTRAMKTPIGLVTRNTSRRKNKICNQPLIVMSELFRTEQRIDQVHHGQRTGSKQDDGLEAHLLLLTLFAHRNARKQSIRQKKQS